MTSADTSRGQRTFRRVATTGWPREVGLVGFLYLLYAVSRLIPNTTLGTATRHGRDILDVERQVHLDPELWLNEHLAHLAALPAIAAIAYQSLHYLVTPAVLCWMYLRRSEHYVRARNWIVIMTFGGLVSYVAFPAAPPRMLAGAGFRDLVAEQHRWGWWGAHGEAPRGLGSMVNEYAAMPSLHVGWAVWSGWLLYRHVHHRALRLAALAYSGVVALVVMSTGNHYFLDVVAGVGFVGAGSLVVGARPQGDRHVRPVVTRMLCKAASSMASMDWKDSSRRVSCNHEFTCG